jgi:hypothetical protein
VAPGAFTTVEDVLGRTLTVPRLAGEQFTPGPFLAQPSANTELGPGERAIALKDTDAQGVMGLLQPGDTVSAVLVDGRANRARLTLTDLRVLRVSFDFRYQEPDIRPAAATTGPIALGGESSGASSTSMSSSSATRKTEGVILLAVPAAVQVRTWQFPNPDPEADRGVYRHAQDRPGRSPGPAQPVGRRASGVGTPDAPAARGPPRALALEWLFPTPEPAPLPPVGGPAPVTPEPETTPVATPEPETP